MSVSEPKLREAYAECRRLASRHYENFPTASYLVPRDKRDALAAVYAFARYADDVRMSRGLRTAWKSWPIGEPSSPPVTRAEVSTRFFWRCMTARCDSACRA